LWWRIVHLGKKDLAAASTLQLPHPSAGAGAASSLRGRWFADPQGRLRNFWAPNKCIDIIGGNTAQGTRLQLWDCVDVVQQRWFL
jgi:hypothetical protein